MPRARASMPGMRPHTIIALALSLLGCSPPTAKSTFEDMKKAACAGDVQGYFSNVDKTAVRESGKKRALALAEDKGIVGELAKELAGPQIDAAAQATFTEWEDDVKKGAAGDLCKMEFTSAAEHEHSGEVFWKTPSGKDKIWRFQRFDKKWLAVELSGVEPPVDVAKECADLLGVFKASADAIAASTEVKAAKAFAPLGKAAGSGAEGFQGLTLRDAGLKQRRRDYVDALKGIAESTKAMDKVTGDDPNGATIINTEGEKVTGFLKLLREQREQLTKHCEKP